MNHTRRIAHVARQRRYLTKAVVRVAVELYLKALADEVTSGDWVDIKDIGKIQVVQEDANGVLSPFGKDGKRIKRYITRRLRTKIRLYERFKRRCRYKQFVD